MKRLLLCGEYCNYHHFRSGFIRLITKHWPDGISGGWNNEYLQLLHQHFHSVVASAFADAVVSSYQSVFVLFDSRICLRHRFHHNVSLSHIWSVVCATPGLAVAPCFSSCWHSTLCSHSSSPPVVPAQPTPDTILSLKHSPVLWWNKLLKGTDKMFVKETLSKELITKRKIIVKIVHS